MQALALRGSELDPSQRAPVIDHPIEVVPLAEGCERWRQAQEHLPVVRGGPSGAEVIDQRCADLFAHRQFQRGASLGLLDIDGCGGPLEIIELEVLDVAQTQTQARREQQDRVVALALGGTAVDGVQQPGHEFGVPYRWHRVLRDTPDGGQRGAEVSRQNVAHEQKP